jgi:peptide/nickel transport system ATP-binding protein
MRLGDTDLTRLNERGFRRLRGKRIAMVLQDPKFSLDPVMTVGKQIAETHRYHFRSSKQAARAAALRMLDAVHIRDPERVYDQYAHQVSGGMGQRIMIAMMLIAGPDLLIADEPTSALDVSVQQQVLAIMDEMVKSRGMGLILISHNLHLVASFCDRVLVMYAGQIVEVCDAGRLHEARHPYTQGLLAALPELGHRRAEPPVDRTRRRFRQVRRPPRRPRYFVSHCRGRRAGPGRRIRLRQIHRAARRRRPDSARRRRRRDQRPRIVQPASP